MIKAHVQPGAVAIDVGANIGVHALTLAAAVGPLGTVACFEPIPHIAAALGRTLRLNGFGDRAKVLLRGGHRQDRSGYRFIVPMMGQRVRYFRCPIYMTAETSKSRRPPWTNTLLQAAASILSKSMLKVPNPMSGAACAGSSRKILRSKSCLNGHRRNFGSAAAIRPRLCTTSVVRLSSHISSISVPATI